METRSPLSFTIGSLPEVSERRGYLAFSSCETLTKGQWEEVLHILSCVEMSFKTRQCYMHSVVLTPQLEQNYYNSAVDNYRTFCSEASQCNCNDYHYNSTGHVGPVSTLALTSLVLLERQYFSDILSNSVLTKFI